MYDAMVVMLVFFLSCIQDFVCQSLWKVYCTHNKKNSDRHTMISPSQIMRKWPELIRCAELQTNLARNPENDGFLFSLASSMASTNRMT